MAYVGKPLGKVIRVSIHTTDTPEGKEFSVPAIRAMHLARGWGDIGYHYLIGLDGAVHLGRDIRYQPAAVEGYNRGMVAVAYVGGMGKDGKAKDTRTPAQKQALARLVNLLAHRYILPTSAIFGHRDLDHLNKHYNGMVGPNVPHDWNKMCPCFEVSEERGGWLLGPRS